MNIRKNIHVTGAFAAKAVVDRNPVRSLLTDFGLAAVRVQCLFDT